MDQDAEILLIDDDPEILHLLELVLERAGYRVRKAANWDQVLDQIQSISGLNRKFDLIILDLMMPGRSGFDMIEEFKHILHPIPPIIVLTAFSGMQNSIRAMESGVTKFLSKPISQMKLLRNVQDVLNEIDFPFEK